MPEEIVLFINKMGIRNEYISGSIENKSYYIGLDIGSISLNTVVLDEDYNVREDYYEYVHGRQ